MTTPVELLLRGLESEASKAWQAEKQLRENFHQELARLERRRAFAFRRRHLVGVLVEATEKARSKNEPTEPARYAALAREVGWRLEGEFQKAIRARLASVGACVEDAIAKAADEGTSGAGDTGALLAAFDEFETWYETTYGSQFYALFDQEPAQVNLVEA